MKCLCLPPDYAKCPDIECANSVVAAARPQDDDDDEMWSVCSHCETRTRFDDLTPHGSDWNLCPKCSGEFIASIMACSHVYDSGFDRDDHGEEGRSCRHCMVFVDRDLAMNFAPFICDGFVEIEGADA